jgi:putative ABC transport system substrate-binding protein
MKRREFITLLGGSAAAWPRVARAQQAAKIARIGFLGATSLSAVEDRLDRFRTGLRDLGYIEGQNILIDFRWAEGRYARLVEFAAELVRLKVDILATYGTPATLAAKQATTTVPIVMIVSGDAVATGIVSSLARPGANVTGSTFFSPELNAKSLELLKEAYPSASRIAVLLTRSWLTSCVVAWPLSPHPRAVTLLRWPKLRPRRSRLSSASLKTQSSLVWSPASRGRAET